MREGGKGKKRVKGMRGTRDERGEGRGMRGERDEVGDGGEG